jgi:peptide/nickel transport system substrate-binding protein
MGGGKIIASVVVSLFVLLLSCQQHPLHENRTDIKTLVIPELQKFSQLSPPLMATTLSSRLAELTFDGLIKLDHALEVQPRLASSWELSKDQLTWVFHIRKGVKFHDGVELTADDVKATFDKLKESASGGKFWFTLQGVKRVVARNKYQVEITLKKPAASFLSDISDMGILPKHLVKGGHSLEDDFGLRPVGTGPFKFKSRSESEIVLEANKDYFLGRPKLDRIVVRVYPNQESVWVSLMNQRVDFFHYISPTTFDLLNQVHTFNLYSVLMPYYYLIAFNVKESPLQEQAVRQALNYAVNKRAIITNVLKGHGQIAAGTIYPNSWAYNPEIKPYPYDPQTALKLLKAAGWEDHNHDHFLDKGGRRLKFTVYTNRGDDLKQQVLLLVQQQLFDLGIGMQVKLFDAADTDFLFQKRFEAHFPEVEAWGDPDLSYRYWHSSQIEGGFNVGSYRNTEVDRLLDEGRHAFDQTKRKAIYGKFQRVLHDDPPGIFLFWTDYLVGVNTRFKGVKISPAGPFANIREWYVDEDQHPGS